MKVLRKHFLGKPTILIHDKIINGCQAFTLNNALEVLNYYGVPGNVWQEVIKVYTGASTLEEVRRFIKDEDIAVRVAVIEHGRLEEKDFIDVIVKDEPWEVRRAFSLKGFFLPEISKDFLDDPDPAIRAALAHQGIFFEDLSKDTSSLVREAALEAKRKQAEETE